MKTILYATDFSKNSVTALKYAHNLSIKLKATLQVIHVYHYPTVYPYELKESVSYLDKNELEKNTFRLNYFCDKHLKQSLNNVNVKAVKNKSVLDGILYQAELLKPIFIVVGSKGMTGLKHLFMGNTTKHLIEKSNFPILSVPKKKKLTDLNTFLYASDFEEKDIQAISKLAEIAKPLNAKIKVVHVSSENSLTNEDKMPRFREMLNEKTSYGNISFDVVVSNDVFNALKLYADKVNADLLAMLERKNGGFLNNLLSKDTVLRMHEDGKYPLISFHP